MYSVGDPLMEEQTPAERRGESGLFLGGDSIPWSLPVEDSSYGRWSQLIE